MNTLQAYFSKLLFLILSLSSLLSAQNQQADSLFALAERHLQAERHDSAQAYYQYAYQEYKTLRQLSKFQETGIRLARLLNKMRKPAEATIILDSTFASFPDTSQGNCLLAELLYWRGHIAFYGRQQELAAANLKAAGRKIPSGCGNEQGLEAKILLDQGLYLHYMEGNIHLAKTNYEASMRAWLESPVANSFEASATMLYLGQALSLTGEFSHALDVYQQALVIRKELFGTDHYYVGSILFNIGNLHFRMDHFDAAETALSEALQIIQQQTRDYSRMEARILNNIAATQRELGHTDLALEYYRLAKSLHSEAGQLEHQARTQLNISEIFQSLGRHREAAKELEDAARILSQNSSSMPRTLARLYERQASLKSAQGDLKQALDYCQKGIAILDSSASANKPKTLPRLENVLDRQSLQGLLSDKIFYLSGIYRENKSDTAVLHQTIATADCLSRLTDLMNSDLENATDKLFLNRNTSHSFANAIKITTEAWEDTGDRKFLIKAFAYMEKNRAQVLLDVVRQARARFVSDMPATQLARKQKLESKIQSLRADLAISDSLSADTLLSRRQNVVSAKLALKLLLDSLNENFPAYQQLMGAQATVQPDTLQALIAQQNVSQIEYFLGDSNLYVFHIQPKGLSLRRTALPNQFTDLLESYLKMLWRPQSGKKSLATFEQLSYGMFQLLLEPELQAMVGQNIHRLCIIPDGRLSLLPFETLVQNISSESPINYRELPMLIFDYVISYAPSSTYLHEQNQQVSEPIQMNCLGFAWSNTEGSETPIVRGPGTSVWSDLPGTGRELAAVSSKIDGQYFFAEEARESRFKSMAGDFSLLHLALHGKAGLDEPFIRFPGTPDDGEDGSLYLHELYQMQVKARVAVLSACETGKGKFSKGEGIMSMARGFAIAGCPAVVTSLWEVDDAAAAEMMAHFYDELKSGADVDLALHRAKLAYIHNASPRATAPFHWASLITIGKVESLFKIPDDAISIWFWAALLLPIVLLLLLWKFRRRIQK